MVLNIVILTERIGTLGSKTNTATYCHLKLVSFSYYYNNNKRRSYYMHISLIVSINPGIMSLLVAAGADTLELYVSGSGLTATQVYYQL